LEIAVPNGCGIEGVSNRLPKDGADMAWASVVGGVEALLESQFLSEDGRELLVKVVRRAYVTGVEWSLR
jgi:hypothetical protein